MNVNSTEAKLWTIISWETPQLAQEMTRIDFFLNGKVIRMSQGFWISGEVEVWLILPSRHPSERLLIVLSIWG